MLFQLLALTAAPSFAAGAPAFDPRQHKNEIAGRPAEILVLGTMHLSQLPHRVDPKLFDPLLDRLARFKPQIITVEGLSGEECDTLRRFKPQHGADTWDTYCWPTDEIEKTTGLNISEAQAEADRTLAGWKGSPAPAQRRRLAMLFLAAGDRGSAMVQWLRLPETERHSGDGLTAPMVEILERKGKPLNENYTIAAALAARLGLERIYEVDDHTADTPLDENSEQGHAYAKAIEGAWKAKPAPPVRAQEDRLEANVRSGADILALYRLMNEPQTQRATIASDMGRNASFTSPELYGRQYVAWWETRNLRIVANIRATLQQDPQGRVLSIIGATHKGYLDAYLNMMQDVRLIDAEQVLR
ncbi:MAG TPA: DUF5694 domain-containing protein [Sphingomicrobium sp.]|jgi:hypothetical protein|nr:DUF5694 domain-containing protein [Sphingomicrobium sp.]